MFSRGPTTLIGIGLFCTISGIVVIKRAIEGDTLMPGTNFTYLPRWLMIATGVLLQLPLVGAFLFIKFINHH